MIHISRKIRDPENMVLVEEERRHEGLTRAQVQTLAAVFLLFGVDLLIPPGVAVSVLYLCCMLLLIKETKGTLIAFSLLTTLLTIVKFMIFYTPAISWMVYANRIISIAAIWITAFVVHRNKVLADKGKLQDEGHLLKIQQKSQELEQFAYIASHDLQEPLRTINNFAGLFNLEYSQTLDDTGKLYLNYIVRSSDRMRELVKGLLDYSRIGKATKLERVSLRDILNEALADLHLLIAESKAKIEVGDLPVANVHPLEFKQLFQNLISNAIKFQKKDQEPIIHISSKDKDHFWKITIKDNGIGIDSTYAEKIFLIFQRLHPKNEYEGSGIGLAHCKKIVDLHDGKIWVKSRPGAGSSFHFTISKNLTCGNL